MSGFGKNSRTTTKWVMRFDGAEQPFRYETQRRELGEDVWPYMTDVTVHKVTRTPIHFVRFMPGWHDQ